jgi:predicted aspartyl protease
MMRQTFVGLALLVSPTVLWAQSSATKFDAASGAPVVDEKTQTEDVKFHNERDDRMTVPVRVSGQGPFRFLVDTGADHTAISREIAGRLGLARNEDATMHTVAGVSMVSTADVPQFQMTQKPQSVRGAPLLESGHMGADGIIGTDSLRSQRVQFDFGTQTLSIVPSAARDFRDEPGTIVVQAQRRKGRLVVTDATADGQPLTVVIDTGAQVSIGNEALRQKLQGRGLVGTSQKVSLQTVTGQTIVGDYMFVRELEIGGVALRSLAIVFTDAHTFRALKLDSRPALLLGMNAIRAFKKVSIDFANQKFRVVLPETSGLDVRFADARL